VESQGARENRQGGGEEAQSPSTWSWDVAVKYFGVNHVQTRHGHRSKILIHEVTVRQKVPHSPSGLLSCLVSSKN